LFCFFGLKNNFRTPIGPSPNPSPSTTPHNSSRTSPWGGDGSGSSQDRRSSSQSGFHIVGDEDYDDIEAYDVADRSGDDE